MGKRKKYIIGLGHQVPATVRTQTDSVFGESGAEAKLFGEYFTGHRLRRILKPEESLATLMADAARQALSHSAVDPRELGALLGYASVSEYTAPNELYAVHKFLALPSGVPVIAVDDPFTAFINCLRLAELEAEVSGKSSLVACGARWSSSVDYRDGVSTSIGDGAGAAVVGLHPSERLGLEIVGHSIHTDSGLYGAMRLTSRAGDVPVCQISENADGRPMFHMSLEMRDVFLNWGVNVPAERALELLDVHRVPSSKVSLMGHQASRRLVEGWENKIRPAKTVDTLETFGNMTLASLPVSLSARYSEVETPYVLMVGLGLGFHTAACLLRLGHDAD
jgi:3-oxoacyl-[acyl-carrier-protein] synthase-3